ncbi:MAG TPA: NfeD family protein [Asticcacaulis sp.]|nr:NfeD family protein [Asticcacaulis sp.]
MLDMNAILLMGPMNIQAFWIWLVLGILLLGVEVFLGTQWLLWAAASAGVVAVLCLTGLPIGFVLQVIIFAVLSLIMTVLTRRFLKAPGQGEDPNNPHARMLGKQAEILSGFERVDGGERTGRVMVDGVEWPAVLTAAAGDVKLTKTDRVVIDQIVEGRLFVTPAA